MNAFQFKIFTEINNCNCSKNIMVSSLSIYHILSLTTNGAEKKTLDEMLNTLCHKNKNEMNKDNLVVSSVLNKFKSIELANAVFTKFNPENYFMNIVKQYKAKVDILKDANQVNKWCSDATHEKITNIIDKITDNDMMVLINAIYFKGVWQKTFDKNKTHKNNFMNFNKNPVNVDFMNISNNFDYFENNDIQAISLNYNEDNMKALIILPKKLDINTYIKGLNADQYYSIVKNLKNKKVNFSLPKFEIKFDAELKKNFISLGMVEAFTNNADFSSMRKENNLKIGRIIHKTFIKVDEQGTEAAGSTAVIMVEKCAMPSNDQKMIVNHPFLFIVRSDNLSPGHDILFMTKVESLNGNLGSKEIKHVINISNKPINKININITHNVKPKPTNINQNIINPKGINNNNNNTGKVPINKKIKISKASQMIQVKAAVTSKKEK